MQARQNLYILASCCDEGFDEPDFVYYAQSRLEVAQRISREMALGTEEGEQVMAILLLSDMGCKVDRDDPYMDNDGFRRKLRRAYILTLSPQKLLDEIDETYVDGDSYFKVSLSEFPADKIIQVSPCAATNTPKDVQVLDSEEDLETLIDFVFQNLTVSHLVWDGKTWYSHSMVGWSSRREDQGDRPWDPDCPCYGYWGHCFDKNAKDKDGDRDKDVALPYKPHFVKSLEDIVHVFNHDGKGPFKLDTKIKLEHNMNIQNPFGHMNSDHRGSNHLGIEIDHLFEGMVEIKAGTYTVAEFANLAWRVKANKFDNQYEAVFHVNNGGEIDLEDKTWHVSLSMDHGS